MHTTEKTEDILKKVEASSRSNRVKTADYQIHLELKKELKTYRGRCEISFVCENGGEVLWLDFRTEELRSVSVNGQALEITAGPSGRISLPEAMLLMGTETNRVAVEYTNHYDTTGEGFHYFKDPQDDEIYLHTDFEPFDAHRLFPCFDQPDIKGRYRVSVTGPAEWEVISCAPLKSRTPLEDGLAAFEFEPIGLFSTYIFHLSAGPYVSFTDSYERSGSAESLVYLDNDGTKKEAVRSLPLGWYCRRSMARYVDPEEIFTVTKQGFEFYESFFETPYPWPKYDQIFVPEFNAGAMENVGAVTYAEVFVFRQQVTENQRLDRADVILHEMAHMWFGNLVTMNWWDGLWLNESFATYMAALATSKATRFGEEAWIEFNARMKKWAYFQDQLPTTHPIHCEVSDTSAAFANFDGISYGKGASVLKQLVFKLGEENFRKGMAWYFKCFAWGNTNLDDFLQSLEQGSGIDLQAWSTEWLLKAGLNTLEYRRDGQTLEASQSAPAEHPTLREHHLEAALYNVSNGRLQKLDPIRLELKGDSARFDLPTADFTFLNSNDHAYIRILLDEGDVDFVTRNLDRFDDGFSDELMRQLLWQTLGEMLRDARLNPAVYIRLVTEKLPLEKNQTIGGAICRNIPLLLFRQVPPANQPAETERLAELCRSQVEQTAGDARLNWLRTWFQIAPMSHAGYLADLLEGRYDLGDFELDMQNRWDITIRLCALGHDAGRKWLDKLSEEDRSDRGRTCEIKALSSIGDTAGKEEFWQRFLEDEDTSLDLLRSAMLTFWQPHQAEGLAEYARRYVDSVAGVFERRGLHYGQAFVRYLFPRYNDNLVMAELEALLNTQLPPVLARMLKELIDEQQRSLRIQANYRELS